MMDAGEAMEFYSREENQEPAGPPVRRAAGRMSRSERELWQRLTRAIGARGDLIYRQPWRLIRNHRLRAEIRAIAEAAGVRDDRP